MTLRPPADRHLGPRAALDYLDGILDAAGRREVEAHLGAPCAACRERVRELGALIQRMRLDRVPPVPAALHARALDAFAPAARPAHPAAAAVEQAARLLFDSWTAPLPAAVRRAVGEARRLRFEFEGGALELECETESAGLAALRGRLEVADAPLHRVVVMVGGEARVTWPDAAGSFAFDQVPAGAARLRIEGPVVRTLTPPITL